MKLVTFQAGGESERPRVGVLLQDGRTVIDLQAAHQAATGAENPSFADMLAFLDDFDRAREAAARTLERMGPGAPAGVALPLGEIRLLAPVPRPRSIRDCMVFRRHYIQAARTFLRWRSPALAALDRRLAALFGRGLIGYPKVGYGLPIYYKSNTFSVVGPDAEVRWPRYTERLDFELEFGVFLGRCGKDIPSGRAMGHVAGYCIFNDWSARDIQMREMGGRLGPTKGKDFDTGNAMGPWLVTADEVPDPLGLAASVRVNGETWADTSTREMSYSFADLIAYISRDETLHPGEFVGSGTMPNGCGVELDRWVRPGDVVELEVERLGVLRNRVVRAAS